MHAWWVYALLSAAFASLTAILAKVGVKGVDPDLATALRTVVILVMAWGIVFFKKAMVGHGGQDGNGVPGGLASLSGLSRHTLIFLGLSGLATGCSWIFYFRALQSGKVSLVAPVDKASLALTILLSVVFLGETLTFKASLGAGLILAGTLVLVL